MSLALPTTVTKMVLQVSCLDQGGSEVYWLYNATAPSLAALITQADAIVAARQALAYGDVLFPRYRLTLSNPAPTTKRQAYVKNILSPPGKISTGTPAFSEPMEVALLVRQQATAGTPPALVHTDRWLRPVPAQNLTSSEKFDTSVGTFAADFATYATALITNTAMVTKNFAGSALIATQMSQVSIVALRSKQAGRVFPEWHGRIAT